MILHFSSPLFLRFSFLSSREETGPSHAILSLAQPQGGKHLGVFFKKKSLKNDFCPPSTNLLDINLSALDQPLQHSCPICLFPPLSFLKTCSNWCLWCTRFSVWRHRQSMCWHFSFISIFPIGRCEHGNDGNFHFDCETFSFFCAPFIARCT